MTLLQWPSRSLLPDKTAVVKRGVEKCLDKSVEKIFGIIVVLSIFITGVRVLLLVFSGTGYWTKIRVVYMMRVIYRALRRKQARRHLKIAICAVCFVLMPLYYFYL